MATGWKRGITPWIERLGLGGRGIYLSRAQDLKTQIAGANLSARLIDRSDGVGERWDPVGGKGGRRERRNGRTEGGTRVRGEGGI